MRGPPAAALQVDAGEHQHVQRQQEAARAHRHPQRHRVAAPQQHQREYIYKPLNEFELRDI